MSRVAIRLSDLAAMPEPERTRAIERLVEAASSLSVEDTLADLDRQIAAYETQYSVDSTTLRREIEQGTRQETWDFCKWLMLLNLRDRVAGMHV